MSWGKCECGAHGRYRKGKVFTCGKYGCLQVALRASPLQLPTGARPAARPPKPKKVLKSSAPSDSKPTLLEQLAMLHEELANAERAFQTAVTEVDQAAASLRTAQSRVKDAQRIKTSVERSVVRVVREHLTEEERIRLLASFEQRIARGLKA